MTAPTSPALRAPLSAWEEDLFNHFTAHTQKETDVLGVYAEMAQSSPDGYVRYLAALLLEDEQRHHRIFTQLANTLASQASLTPGPDDVPSISRTEEAADLGALTQRLVDLEEDDAVELARLRKELKPVRETTLWDLLVQLAQRDTEKHLLILKFIAGVAKREARH
ncbi:MAG TPA: hypothetical protein VN193_12080 [Candidatus Angelobacter sp.]|jgi:hypothetical protein|nr:hypothetical protein [Candidatus Angelobacter sp.]